MKGAAADFAKQLEYTQLDRIINDADLVVVAFSGGADSALLLYLMNEYLSGRNTRLAACHLNHLIRGEEAFRDERFAESFAEKLGVPFYLKRVDIPAISGGTAVEETARRERYAFFDELAESLSPKTLIATAHNADDNLETVLFNLVRGSGLSGLCGIPRMRDSRYVRPLLSYSSAEIRSLADGLGIPYVVDSTNLSCDYTRNKLRNLVIPYLKELNPAAHLALLRMSDALREDEAYLSGEAEAFLSRCNEACVPRAELAALKTAILTRVILRMHGTSVPESASLENVHIREICRLLAEHRGDFSISVPSGVSFICERGMCRFGRITKDISVDITEDILELDRPVYKNGYVTVVTADNLSKYYPLHDNVYNLAIYTPLKFDKIKGKLKVRNRKEGDTIRFGGMTRKVKKLFSDRKLPAEIRERIPIVCDDGGIVFIPTFPVRDGMRAENGEDVLHIFCFEEKEFEKFAKAEMRNGDGYDR